MPASPLSIAHIKTSKQYDGALLINRYWFQWSDRRNLSNLVVRFDLLDDAGNVLTTSSVKLPKVSITGYMPGDSKPVYSGTVFITIDDVATHQATQFRYYVVTGILTKSDSVTGPMVGLVEDLSMHG